MNGCRLKGVHLEEARRILEATPMEVDIVIGRDTAGDEERALTTPCRPISGHESSFPLNRSDSRVNFSLNEETEEEMEVKSLCTPHHLNYLSSNDLVANMSRFSWADTDNLGQKTPLNRCPKDKSPYTTEDLENLINLYSLQMAEKDNVVANLDLRQEQMKMDYSPMCKSNNFTEVSKGNVELSNF